MLFCALAISFFVFVIKVLSLPSQFFSGKGALGGIGATITFFLEGAKPIIRIIEPLNTTYYFNIGSPYLLNLSVYTNESNLIGWRYTLFDLKHNLTINESVPFEPNTTFYAVRWQNKLSVFANDSKTGEVGQDSVIFFIQVPNSAPSIENLSEQIYACENSGLNVFFNVSDPDEDDLQIGISPADLIFAVYPTASFGKKRVDVNLFSILLNKNYVGNYSKDIFVVDGEGKIDIRKVNITVIEVNNMPSLGGILGAYTLYTKGEGSSTIIQATIYDIEGGNKFESGNFSINLSVLSGVKFFDFNEYGAAYVGANESLVGIHTYRFCVTDKGVQVHPNISLCEGQTALNNTVCKDFSITVTDENRPPTITSYYPLLTDFIANATETLYFNISSFDPDGTIPDSYWYVDGKLVKYEQNDSSYLYYAFGCDGITKHSVMAVVSDGLLNDSVEWNINLSFELCPKVVPGVGGGGGGGVGALGCVPKWICNDWSTCQNTEGSLKTGVLAGEDYRDIKNICLRDSLGEETCGFQTRSCFDLNACNTSLIKPSEMQICYYSSEPSCFDGIKNCHHGACEFLVDCGGPCKPCPTCSDKIKNQNEEGVDCGGPCPPCPPAAIPFYAKKDFVKIVLIILNLLLLLIILIILARIILKYIRNKLKK